MAAAWAGRKTFLRHQRGHSGQNFLARIVSAPLPFYFVDFAFSLVCVNHIRLSFISRSYIRSPLRQSSTRRSNSEMGIKIFHPMRTEQIFKLLIQL